MLKKIGREGKRGMDVALWALGGGILLAAAAVAWAVVGRAKKAKVVVTTRFQRVGAFVFRRRDGSDLLRMRACTGWVKRRLFREETGQLTFQLQEELTEGEGEVVLLDGERELLRLDREHPAGTVTLAGETTYLLQWTFQKASGRCTLSW